MGARPDHPVKHCRRTSAPAKDQARRRCQRCSKPQRADWSRLDFQRVRPPDDFGGEHSDLREGEGIRPANEVLLICLRGVADAFGDERGHILNSDRIDTMRSVSDDCVLSVLLNLVERRISQVAEAGGWANDGGRGTCLAAGRADGVYSRLLCNAECREMPRRPALKCRDQDHMTRPCLQRRASKADVRIPVNRPAIIGRINMHIARRHARDCDVGICKRPGVGFHPSGINKCEVSTKVGHPALILFTGPVL